VQFEVSFKIYGKSLNQTPRISSVEKEKYRNIESVGYFNKLTLFFRTLYPGLLFFGDFPKLDEIDMVDGSSVDAQLLVCK